MSILYDEGQQAIASESRRILEAHVTTEALLPLLETRDAIFEPFWTIAKEQGWTAVALPEAYGGLGLGLVGLGLGAPHRGRRPPGAAFLTPRLRAARPVPHHCRHAPQQARPPP